MRMRKGPLPGLRERLGTWGLRTWRGEYYWPVSAFAAVVGKSEQTVRLWERLGRIPPFDHVKGCVWLSAVSISVLEKFGVRDIGGYRQIDKNTAKIFRQRGYRVPAKAIVTYERGAS